jgi:endoglucanase
MTPVTRRALLGRAGAAAGLVAIAACAPSAVSSPAPPAGSSPAPSTTPALSVGPTFDRLPRWRGFDITEQAPYQTKPLPFDVWDFDFMAEHGFDFARLAVDFRRWTPAPGAFSEAGIAEVDRGIALARDRKIHASLDLHVAPGHFGYLRPSIRTLWEDGAAGDEARRQFADVWRRLARRYNTIPSSELSFGITNEPPNDVTPAQYLRAAEPTIAAIRAEDPARLIIADGTNFGRLPVT